MVMIVGHRGARNIWPENSLSGFRRTAALGIEAVEFDVHLSRDGTPVVIHDPTLERTAEADGPVSARSDAELAATRLRDGAGDTVPTLDAVLEVFRAGSIELQIEIKTDHAGHVHAGLERAVIGMVRRKGMAERARITSFIPAVLETTRSLWPEAPILASLDRRSAEMLGGLGPALDRFLALDGCHIAVEKSLLVSAFDVCLARIGSDRLGAWVPNERAEIAYWMGQPIRQITTDRPDIGLDVRGRG